MACYPMHRLRAKSRGRLRQHEDATPWSRLWYASQRNAGGKRRKTIRQAQTDPPPANDLHSPRLSRHRSWTAVTARVLAVCAVVRPSGVTAACKRERTPSGNIPQRMT